MASWPNYSLGPALGEFVNADTPEPVILPVEDQYLLAQWRVFWRHESFQPSSYGRDAAVTRRDSSRNRSSERRRQTTCAGMHDGPQVHRIEALRALASRRHGRWRRRSHYRCGAIELVAPSGGLVLGEPLARHCCEAVGQCGAGFGQFGELALRCNSWALVFSAHVVTSAFSLRPVESRPSGKVCGKRNGKKPKGDSWLGCPL